MATAPCASTLTNVRLVDFATSMPLVRMAVGGTRAHVTKVTMATGRIALVSQNKLKMFSPIFWFHAIVIF